MAAEIGVSRHAKPLAVGFGGTYGTPSPTIRDLAEFFVAFRSGYAPFVEILARAGTTVDFIDDFAQTWDACQDFLYDYEPLQSGRPLAKRQPALPESSHPLARYVYIDDDIIQLKKRVGLQLRIMHAKIDAILCTSWSHIYAAAEGVSFDFPVDVTSLEDADENVLALYDRLDRFSNLLKRAVPHPQPLTATVNVAQNRRPSRDDVTQLRDLLKARLHRHGLNQEGQLRREYDLDALADDNLKTLLETYSRNRQGEPPTSRQRVYERDSSTRTSSTSFVLPEPALPVNADTTIFIGLRPPVSPSTDHGHVARSIDVVSRAGHKLIVCCFEEDGPAGIVQHVPKMPEIYPYTHHTTYASYRPSGEVSLYEKCTVEHIASNGVATKHTGVRPRYRFPSSVNASTFQSALRGKYLRGTFPVVKIVSKRGREAVAQHLKLWTSFDGGHGSLSFLQHGNNRGERHLEYRVTDFDDKLATDRHQTSFRMEFNRVAQTRQRSRISLDIVRRPSSFFKLHRTSSASSSPSLEEGVIPNAPLTEPTPLPSPALAHPDTNESPTSSVGTYHSTVNPDSMEMEYLEIIFASSEEAGSFDTAFRRVLKWSRQLVSSPLQYHPSGSIDPPLAPPAPFPPVQESVSSMLEQYRFPQPSPEGGNNRAPIGARPPGSDTHIDPSTVLGGEERDSPSGDNRPDTLRVKNIPKSFSKNQVEFEIWSNCKCKPCIHSLVSYVSGYNCATITFAGSSQQRGEAQAQAQAQAHDYQFKYDSDFYGLTPLYDVGDEAVVDIIAVPGLGAHAFGTFRSPLPDSSEMWLRDFLPENIPESRIVLYGYPSEVNDSKSIEKIEDIASTMLDRLSHFRRNTLTQARPIIFIGQSLGGLIVQQSLTMAAESSNAAYLKIFAAWHGLIGFGIPIAGLHNPSLLAAVKDQPNQALVKQICVDDHGTPSQYLKELKEKFESCCQQQTPKIIYFWETYYSQPRSRGGAVGQQVLMVPKEDTATHGARHLPLNSDHRGMVKYKHKSDELYEDVCNNISSMVQSIAPKMVPP